MAQQPLFCVAEDRHRAVLLTGALSDLGIPVVQANQPGEPQRQPALVLWTRRAAEAPWLARIFENYPETIALVLDDVALPSACTRSVPLQSWPARSADASIGALARWLKNPARARTPFDSTRTQTGPRSSPADKTPGADRTATGNSAAQDRSRQAAFGIIAACLLLLVVVLMTDSELELESDNPDSATVADISSERSPASATVPDLVGSQTAPDKPEATLGEPADALPARTEPARAARVEPVSGKSTAGDDSLSHLCRARSLAAALAWYRVLTPAQQRLAPTLDCVQALLARPGFTALEEAFQA